MKLLNHMDGFSRNPLSVRRLAALAGAVAVGAIVLQASAYHGDDAKRKDSKLEGTLDQPLAKAARKQASANQGGQWQQEGSTSKVVMTQSSGGNTYTLRIENGKRTAEINGKEVPENRIREKDGVTELLGEKGEVVASFGSVITPTPGAIALRWGGEEQLHGLDDEAKAQMRAELLRLSEQIGRDGNWNRQGVLPATALALTNPPSVMLGINMDSDNENPGIVLGEVKPGLPADKAGLKVGDRIVAIGEHAIEKPGDVRKALDQFKPGEKAVIGFIRGEEKQSVTLEFEAFDAEKLGVNQFQFNNVAPGMVNRFPARDEAWFADAHRRLEKALEEIKNSEKYDQVKKIAEDSLQKAKKALEEAHAKVAADWTRFLNEGQNRFADPEGRIFVERPAPPAPVAPAAPVEIADERMTKKIERLTEILERLDKRLDEIERRIEKK